jgi:Domain of unknown function (DUF4276)
MMFNPVEIICIVEGDGEVIAIPRLLVRACQCFGLPLPKISRPIRVRRDQFINKDDSLRRHVALAKAKAGSTGHVFIILDADDDCPVDLVKNLFAKIASCASTERLHIILIEKELEVWFIEDIEQLKVKFNFDQEAIKPAKPTNIRDAKGWIKNHFKQSYSEVTDPLKFVQQLDINLVHQNNRSMQKLIKSLQTTQVISTHLDVS